MEYLPLAGPAAIADALLLQRGAWVLVVFLPAELEQGMRRIRAELEFLLAEDQDDKGAVHVIKTPATGAAVLACLDGRPEVDVVLLTQIEDLVSEELEYLDLYRNRALHSPHVLIATTPEGADRLSTHSPDLWSWFGAHCLRYDPSEGRMNVAERLQSLRDHFKMSDLNVINLAERGELPSDVAFTEWLILLRRGDLLGR
jgi:hypothetical protein